jgi:glycosyltransferase involved in cell wall biosynthesis
MTAPTRRIAIVGHPWENVVARSASSMVIIAYQLARHLPPHWRLTLYGRLRPGQRRRETDGEYIEIKRFSVRHRPHALLEALLGILACYTKRRLNYHMSYFYHTFYTLRVALSIRASKYDIVIVNNFPQFASIIKLFNPSATICLSMHCEWLSQYATMGAERRLRGLDLIIGCSEYITDAIRKCYPAIAARCHTVYDGVDTNRFCPTSESSARNEGTERLLYVGRLVPEKGIHVLIRAFKILVESRPTLRLDLVGATNTGRYLYLCPDLKDPAIANLVHAFYGDRLSEMVRRQLTQGSHIYLDDLLTLAGGDERIVFHGAVSHEETIDLYRRATMLVFPSIWQEPSGFPTFEAQACGKPVVSTFSGGIPEYVENGHTGILVERGEAHELALAIAQVLDNPDLAGAMGEAGRRRAVGHFSLDVMSRDLFHLIQGLSPSTETRVISTKGARLRDERELRNYTAVHAGSTLKQRSPTSSDKRL